MQRPNGGHSVSSAGADKIVVVDGGRIVESGSHDQLMQLKGKYAEMFENQAKDYQ